MKPEIAAHVNNAIDEILSEYKKNPHIIFDSDYEQRCLRYQFIDGKVKAWNKRKQCIYRNCRNKSIKRSHSIQKSGSLKQIVDNGKILTPQFNINVGTVELAEKGLSQASTFPGFCEKHESLFNSFENSKNIVSVEAISLQIYRSICREIVRLKYQIEFGKRAFSKYESFRDKKLKEIFENKIGADWMRINNVKVKNMSITGDPPAVFFHEEYTDLATTMKELETQHLSEIEECLKINNKTTEGTLSPVLISIDEKIPVALSGMGSFYVAEGKHSKRVLIVLLVLPNEKGTAIVISGKLSDTQYVHDYLSRLKNSFDILNMVEQWMIRGTDHWFLSHEVWDKKKLAERAAIMKEILNDRKGLTDEFSFSIFDDIRKSMIKTWKSEENIGDSELEILSREQAKLQRCCPSCYSN